MNLQITHSVLSIASEKRVDASISIGQLKEKLYAVVGTAPEHQRLQLRNKDGEVIAQMDDDSRSLSSYGVAEYANVHVVDVDPMQSTAQFSDVSQVEKYTISEEAYSARDDTFRKFKEKVLSNPEAEAKKALEHKEKEEKETKQASEIKVGDRCQVNTVSGEKRGEVMFVGDVHWTEGKWVGVKLDEPLGNHDGSLKGKRYFSCANKHGVVVRPSKVQVGDFPEVGLDDEDDDEDVMAEL